MSSKTTPKIVPDTESFRVFLTLFMGEGKTYEDYLSESVEGQTLIRHQYLEWLFDDLRTKRERNIKIKESYQE